MLDIRQGDALALLQTLPDNSVDLIATDPPYYRVKKDAWDRAWDKPNKFLAWFDTILAEFQRVLRPNGSLYLFASPKMSARVEVLIGERFNVLSNLVWNKLADYDEGDQRATAYRARDHKSFRRFFYYSERIIFAEHYNKLGERLYRARVDAGLTCDAIERSLGYVDNKGRGSRLFYRWERGDSTPTEKDFCEALQVCHPDLKHETLRQEYKTLRRPFYASPDAPYTDVWTFKTVKPYAGKHSCEKPLELMQHIIKTSSRPGAVVLDAFMGSGSTGEAALTLGRDFIGFDLNPHWVKHSRSRCNNALSQIQLFANTAD